MAWRRLCCSVFSHYRRSRCPGGGPLGHLGLQVVRLAFVLPNSPTLLKGCRAREPGTRRDYQGSALARSREDAAADDVALRRIVG